ncbi:MAG: GAF domain-containing protein [Chloroflexota bacterium]|nr:GAF domain-containing protein [Chloroflexota bacterium]
MSELQKWRTVLGTIIENVQERRHIATSLGISPVTLTRWANNESNPRAHNLQQLLSALPEHASPLLKLIREEFPEFAEQSSEGEDEPLAYPYPQFYANVLQAVVSTAPMLRFWTICNLILQQSLQQLDPHHLGMVITIINCTPPGPENKVRSLNIHLGQSTKPWDRNWGRWPLLLGIETLSGYVVATGHAVTIQDAKKDHLHYPTLLVEKLNSAYATPIRHIDGIAGCLCICSTQPHYFTQSRQNLIQNYANLLTLAFDPEQFYEPASIELGVMPPEDVQRPYFANFHQRLIVILKRAAEQGVAINQQVAEQRVWQEIEKEILQASITVAV